MTDTHSIFGPMQPWVAAQIASGRFASEAEVVQAALLALAERDAKVSNLRALVQQGLDDKAAGRVHDYADAEAMAVDIL